MRTIAQCDSCSSCCRTMIAWGNTLGFPQTLFAQKQLKREATTEGIAIDSKGKSSGRALSFRG